MNLHTRDIYLYIILLYLLLFLFIVLSSCNFYQKYFTLTLSRFKSLKYCHRLCYSLNYVCKLRSNVKSIVLVLEKIQSAS